MTRTTGKFSAPVPKSMAYMARSAEQGFDACCVYRNLLIRLDLSGTGTPMRHLL